MHEDRTVTEPAATTNSDTLDRAEWAMPASTGTAADADRPPGQDLPANGEAKRSRSDAMKAFHRRTGKGTLMGNALVRRARRPT
jgi:hypothetical protein